MKIKIKLVLLVCTAFAVLGACRPTVDLTPINSTDGDPGGFTYVTTSDSYADIFKTFWQGMDTNYAFWDVEPESYWDVMWNTYKPQFETLGTYNTADTVNVGIAQGYIKAMVAPLKDGHLSVDFASGYNCYPSKDRSDIRYADKDPNTDPKTIFHFWNPPSVLTTGGILQNVFTQCGGETLQWALEGPGDDALQMATGKIPLTTGGHIRYLYFSKFEISNYLYNNGEVATLMGTYWTGLRDPECKGLIFDMRGNGGGDVPDIALIICPLLENDLHYENIRLKKSPARMDYTAWMPDVLKANPADGEFTLDDPATPTSRYYFSRAVNAGKIPVVALINDYSVSCGEALPIAVQAMPRGHLIGTNTYGATGPRQESDSPRTSHGGCFTHNKLWTKVTQAGWQAKGLQFENYEGVGITPDEPVEFDLAQFIAGTDVQLVKAVAYVNEHQ